MDSSTFKLPLDNDAVMLRRIIWEEHEMSVDKDFAGGVPRLFEGNSIPALV